MAETKEAFKAEVSEVCRFYCLQVWNEVLDRARVKASFALRRAKNVYYPPAIRVSGSKANLMSKEVDVGKESPTETLPTANISSEVAEQFEDTEKAANLTKEMPQDAPYLQTPSKSPQRRKRFPKT